MGEYWQICNLTRGEMYDTRGHYKTCGTMTYEMRGALLWLLGTDRWKETDDIRLLSDWGQERLLNKETWEATESHGNGASMSQLTDIHFQVVGRGAAKPELPRFDEEKPPTPKASRYEPEPDDGKVMSALTGDIAEGENVTG